MQVRSLHEIRLPEKHSRFMRTYLDSIANERYVDKVILFGSCARGNANSESDIDLFIVTTTVLADDSEELYHLLYKSTEHIPLSDYVGCDILTASIDDFKQQTTPLIRAILREGIELHGVFEYD